MLQPLANITIVNITLNQAFVSVGNITGLAGQASKAHGRDTLVVVYMCNVFLAGQHLSTALLLCLYCPQVFLARHPINRYSLMHP